MRPSQRQIVDPREATDRYETYPGTITGNFAPFVIVPEEVSFCAGFSDAGMPMDPENVCLSR
jgi:hypothetical protein